MKRLSVMIAALLVVVFAVAGCGQRLASSGWVTLIDGERGFENFNRIGDANWRAEGGAIVADKGNGGFLVTKNSYRDFEIHAQFWAATDTNSGIFLRVSDPREITPFDSYEVNIWDIRPDPTYGTAAIVDLASVPVPTVYKAGGRWNTFHITAKGPELTVVFNGVVTVYTRDSRFKEGPFALQYGAGVNDAMGGPIKWRKVEVRAL